MVPNDDGDEEEGMSEKRKRVVNFASVSAGAVVLESSAQSTKFHNLLNDDKDKYGMTQCSEKKWVVLGLSEDVSQYCNLGVRILSIFLTYHAKILVI